jgi:hypothetical protein
MQGYALDMFKGDLTKVLKHRRLSPSTHRAALGPKVRKVISDYYTTMKAPSCWCYSTSSSNRRR